MYKKYCNGQLHGRLKIVVAIIACLILFKRLKLRLVQHCPLLTKNCNVSIDVINYTNNFSYLLSCGILNV